MADYRQAAFKAWNTRRRRAAAKKAWETIRKRYGKEAGSKIAIKAWKTRRMS